MVFKICAQTGKHTDTPITVLCTCSNNVDTANIKDAKNE